MLTALRDGPAAGRCLQGWAGMRGATLLSCPVGRKSTWTRFLLARRPDGRGREYGSIHSPRVAQHNCAARGCSALRQRRRNWGRASFTPIAEAGCKTAASAVRRVLCRRCRLLLLLLLLWLLWLL